MNRSIIFFPCFCAAMVPLRVAAEAQDPWKNTVWGGFEVFDDWKKDFTATVGVKVWLNEWRRDAPLVDPVSFDVNGQTISVVNEDSKPRSTTSNLAITPIPQLSIKYKWLFFSASYYSDTSFTYNTTSRRQTVSGGGLNFSQTISDQATAERYEYDFAGGIFVHPNIAIFGGYKRIRQSQHFIFEYVTSNGIGDRTETPNRELDVSGPTIGFAASVPAFGNFGLYGTYAHGFLDADITQSGLSTQFTRTASYDVAEVGITYTRGLRNLPVNLPLSAANVYAGYRYQAFETETAQSTETPRSDSTRGFVAGVNFAW